MSTSAGNPKLVIPANVEGKIRYLQNKFPTTEWSGVLFVTHEGTFEDNNLVITCKDIYPMDLGNATYTEFFMSEEVANYVSEHMDELWECDMALVHSHNQMEAFFSGTDLNTLREEGNDRNTFVSLIVNNEGSYCAAITRKITRDVTINYKGTYNFFGDEQPRNCNDVQTRQDTVIQYFMMDIQKETVDNPYACLDKRFDEIEERKRTAIQRQKPSVWMPHASIPSSQEHVIIPPLHKEQPQEKKTKQTNLWEATADPIKIQQTVAQVLLTSFIIDPSKVNLKKWVDNSMVKMYDNAFKGSDTPMFEEYAEWVIGFAIDYYEDDNLLEVYEHSSYEYGEAVANALWKEMNKYYNGNNPYISAYLDILESYSINVNENKETLEEMEDPDYDFKL